MEEFLNEYEVYSQEELIEKAKGVMQELYNRNQENLGKMNIIEHVLFQLGELEIAGEK